MWLQRHVTSVASVVVLPSDARLGGAPMVTRLAVDNLRFGSREGLCVKSRLTRHLYDARPSSRGVPKSQYLGFRDREIGESQRVVVLHTKMIMCLEMTHTLRHWGTDRRASAADVSARWGEDATTARNVGAIWAENYVSAAGMPSAVRGQLRWA
jgi:hypothetical protein